MSGNITTTRPRGYFAIGAERISKPGNLGNLVRSAHAFGASFFFTVEAHYRLRGAQSDTSKAGEHIPYYSWPTITDMQMPGGCELVGIELLDEAIDLPSFHHPKRAAYVLGPEAGSLSPEMRDRCTSFVRIPTAFCVNIATAGAIVMYDRIKTLGNYPARPVSSIGMPESAIAPAEAYAASYAASRMKVPASEQTHQSQDPRSQPPLSQPPLSQRERAARVRAPRSASRERP